MTLCTLGLFLTSYCWKLLTSRFDLLPGSGMNDFYQIYQISRISLDVMKHGFPPVGSYWIPLYGGTPATFFQGNLLDTTTILFILGIGSTGSIGASAKITLIVSLGLAIVTSTVLGQKFFGDLESSVIFALGYCFSAYVYTEVFWGHAASVLGIAMLPLAIYAWEKNLESLGLKAIVLASVSSFLLFLTEWYIFFYGSTFIVLRYFYHLSRESSSADRKLITLRLVLALVVLVLAIAPLLIPFFVFYMAPSSAEVTLMFAANPEFYALRSIPLGTSARAFMAYQWIGIGFLFLSLIPLFLRKGYQCKAKGTRSSLCNNHGYYFFLSTAALFMLYSVGRNAPISVFDIVSPMFPIVVVFRVLAKSSILVFLCFSACAAIGFLTLKTNPSFSGFFTSSKLKRTVLRRVLVLLVLILLFFDLTYGFKPIVTEPFRPNPCHDFVRLQEGEFRIVDTVDPRWATSNFVAAYMGRDMPGLSPIAIREYPKRSATWSELLKDVLALPANLSRYGEVRKLTTIWAVKYLIVSNSQNDSRALGLYKALNSSADFLEVFGDKQAVVFENKKYLGMAFAIDDESDADQTVPSTSTNVKYSRMDPNTIELLVNTSTPARIIVSETFMDGWQASEESHMLVVEPCLGVCSIRVAEGTHHIRLHFRLYEQSLYLFLVFYSLLAIAVLALWRGRFRSDRVRKLFPKVCVVLIAYGLATIASSQELFEICDSRMSVFGQITTCVGGVAIAFAIATFSLFRHSMVAHNAWRSLAKLSRNLLHLVENRRSIVVICLTSPTMLFASTLFARNMAGMWIHNTWVAIIVYMSKTGSVLVLSAAIALTVATLGSIRSLKDHISRIVSLTCAIMALSTAGRIMTESTIYVPLDFFNFSVNTLLPLTVAILLGSATLILRPPIQQIPAVSKSMGKPLGFIALSSMFVANVLPLNQSVANILSLVSFYSIVVVALFYGYLYVFGGLKPQDGKS